MKRASNCSLRQPSSIIIVYRDIDIEAGMPQNPPVNPVCPVIS